MLATKILKLRLARIEKGKEHLSTQDKLMLVSMESPDLSAHFLLRLFKVSLPKQWKFQHETEDDIRYTTQLIQLIEEEFIPAYESHARKHAWYEQGLMYRLNFIDSQPAPSQLKLYLRQLEPCLDQQPKIDLLRYFQKYYPSPLHALALAKAYAGAQHYTQAIEQYEWAVQQSSQRNETAFYGYIDCLIQRNQSEYQPKVSDVEYAIDLLCKFSKPIDQQAYQQSLQRAVSALLPTALLKTRAVETNILADVGRGLNLLGKSLGEVFGGRDYRLPYREEVIASAPQLLSGQIIQDSLVQATTMQQAVERLLDNDNTQMGSQHLLGLWQSMQKDPDILKYLTAPVQKDQFLAELVPVEPIQEHQIHLGQIEIILSQGLMVYLGEVRLDKQHPERHALYEQRDRVVQDMIAFAFWFYQDVLTAYVQQQTQLLQQVQTLLIGQLDEISLSSGLFAYQFEMQQRAQSLSLWMQQKLEKKSEFEQMQAAWVALREIPHFMIDEGQNRVKQIEDVLNEYQSRRLSQAQRIQKDEGEVQME